MHHDCVLPIVHGDLWSNYILMDFDYEAHISDFGMAQLLKVDKSNRNRVAGTYEYGATEFAYTMKVMKKCNIYSLVVPLANAGKVLDNILDSRLPPPPPEWSIKDELVTIFQLAAACWSHNLYLNPTAKMVSQVLSVQSLLVPSHPMESN